MVPDNGVAITLDWSLSDIAATLTQAQLIIAAAHLTTIATAWLQMLVSSASSPLLSQGSLAALVFAVQRAAAAVLDAVGSSPAIAPVCALGLRAAEGSIAITPTRALTARVAVQRVEANVSDANVTVVRWSAVCLFVA